MFESDKGLLALCKPTFIFRMDSGEFLANPLSRTILQIKQREEGDVPNMRCSD